MAAVAGSRNIKKSEPLHSLQAHIKASLLYNAVADGHHTSVLSTIGTHATAQITEHYDATNKDLRRRLSVKRIGHKIYHSNGQRLLSTPVFSTQSTRGQTGPHTVNCSIDTKAYIINNDSRPLYRSVLQTIAALETKLAENSSLRHFHLEARTCKRTCA